MSDTNQIRVQLSLTLDTRAAESFQAFADREGNTTVSALVEKFLASQLEAFAAETVGMPRMAARSDVHLVHTQFATQDAILYCVSCGSKWDNYYRQEYRPGCACPDCEGTLKAYNLVEASIHDELPPTDATKHCRQCDQDVPVWNFPPAVATCCACIQENEFYAANGGGG